MSAKRRIPPQIRRPVVVGTGSLVAVTGLVLMPVPGPGGTPVFLAGLALLATELGWAQRLLERFKQTAGKMSRRRKIVLSTAAGLFYLVSGIAAWYWVYRRD